MYATGTASSPSALLAALASFASSAGWTVDHNAVYTSGDYWLAVHKDLCYLNYYSQPGSTGVIEIIGATGYSSGSGPRGQANHSDVSVTNKYVQITPGVGPYTGYHFFSTTTSGVDYLHMVLEASSGIFQHLYGGCLAAAGGASPATYITCSQWSQLTAGGYASYYDNYTVINNHPFGGSYNNATQLLATVDSVQQWFTASTAYGVSPGRMIPALQTGSKGKNFMQRCPNTFNQLTPLLPLSLYVERAAGNIFSYIGDPIDVRGFNMANNAPKDEITIGSDTWKVFPTICKTPLNVTNIFGNPPSSYNYGFALRKNA